MSYGGVGMFKNVLITSIAVTFIICSNCFGQHVFKEARTWIDKKGTKIAGVAWKTTGDGIKVKTKDGRIVSYPYSSMTKLDEAYVSYQVKEYVKQKKAATAEKKATARREAAKKREADRTAAAEKKPTYPKDSKEARIAKLRRTIGKCNSDLEPAKGLLTKPAVKYQVSSRWVNANGGYFKPIYRTTKAETISVMIANGKVVGYPNYPSWSAYSSYHTVKLSPKSVKVLAKQQNALRLKADAERELNGLARSATTTSSTYSSGSSSSSRPSSTHYSSRTTRPRELTEEDSARISKLQKSVDRYNGQLKPVKGLLFRRKSNTTLVKESVSVMIANGEVVGYPDYPRWYYDYSYHTVELSPKSVKVLGQQKDVLRKKKDAEDEIRRIRGY